MLTRKMGTNWKVYYMKEDSPKDRSYYCDKCGFLAEKREKLRSHMKAVHRDGDFSIRGQKTKACIFFILVAHTHIGKIASVTRDILEPLEYINSCWWLKITIKGGVSMDGQVVVVFTISNRTLSCDDKLIWSHKVIIASTSPVLRNILKFNQNPHPLEFINIAFTSQLQSLVSKFI